MRDANLGTQTEDMVVDALYHVLYVVVEDKGIWKLSARTDGSDTLKAQNFKMVSWEKNQCVASQFSILIAQVAFPINLTILPDGRKTF